MSLNDFIQIGSRIKFLRKEKGMSQKEMAKTLGLKASTYSGYENNYRVPNAEMLKKIAEALGTDVSSLIIQVPKNTTVNWYLEKIMLYLGYEIYIDDLEHPRYIIYKDVHYRVDLQDLEVLYKQILAFVKFSADELITKSKNQYPEQK